MTDPIEAPDVVAPAAAEVPAGAAPVTTPVTAPAQETITPVAPETTTEGAWVPVTEDIKYSGVKYGDLDVEVVIPTEMANLAGEHGIDVGAISKELYASEDFSLKPETLEPLYEAFGKWQVDAYLSGIKAKNDAMSSDYKTGVETQTANEEAAWTATMEIMGGEDRWDDLSAYAQANLSDAEIAEFNTVMADGSLYMQQLMIKDVYGRFSEAGAPVAATILDLEEGSNGGDPGAGQAPLTQVEYLDLLKTGKYKEDPAKFDALRRAGMKKGI